MLPIKRFAGWITASAAAVGAVVIAVVIARSASEQPKAVASSFRSHTIAVEVLPSVDRMEFVPRGTLLPTPATASPDDDDAAQANDAKPRSGWTTATVTEPSLESAWRAILTSPSNAPAQNAKRAEPRRVYTLKTRLTEISIPALARLSTKFQEANVAWPPSQIALIALKDEKVLELHARQNSGPWKLVHRYRVLAASGQAGPKLRQGDKQVPEGIYSIESLNPNSAYHVSMRVNYPNAFDRAMATKDGRKELGGDIMIHGKNLSAGCLAVGDESVEELFVLASQTGLPNVKLIIAPQDFRANRPAAPTPEQPEWLPKLYAELATAMAEFPVPKANPSLLSFFFK